MDLPPPCRTSNCTCACCCLTGPAPAPAVSTTSPAAYHIPRPSPLHEEHRHIGQYGLMRSCPVLAAENLNPACFMPQLGQHDTVMTRCFEKLINNQWLILIVYIIVIIRISLHPLWQLVWRRLRVPPGEPVLLNALKRRSPKGRGGMPWKESRDSSYLILQCMCCIYLPENSRFKK